MSFISDTLEAFDHQNNLIREYDNWYVLLRPRQVTLGSLVLLCKDDVDAFSKISKNSFANMDAAIQDIERSLSNLFNYEKINYLMLMHKDPAVHFHVIPRYTHEVEFNGEKFTDPGWPGLPNMENIHELSIVNREKLKETLIEEFNKSRG